MSLDSWCFAASDSLCWSLAGLGILALHVAGSERRFHKPPAHVATLVKLNISPETVGKLEHADLAILVSFNPSTSHVLPRLGSLPESKPCS